MDYLKLIDQLDLMKILYEPIYSADAHEITGYEVIAYIEEDGKTVYIEDITYAKDIPLELRFDIEHMVVKKSIEAVHDQLTDVQLFVPCNPNLLMHDIGEKYMQMLQDLLGEERLHLITLVVKEHLYEGDLKALHHVIRYFKTYGITFALSDVGEASHLDNILLVEPSIIKIKITQLNYNKWGARNPVFSTLRSLAFKIGASLMVEGIEESYQLHQGWKHGIRYYKGEYLEKPAATFIDRHTLKDRFRKECEQFILTERKILEQKYDRKKELEKAVYKAVDENFPSSSRLDVLMKLAEKIDEFAFRLYICNEKGFQTTPNIIKRDGEWVQDHSALGKNWSWRPYFLSNLIKMRKDQQWELTQSYIDIETNEHTRTFSLALKENEYLFIDISYSYLYDQNIIND